MTGLGPPRLTRSTHLVGLIATAERFAALIEAAPPTDEVREEVAAEAAVASCRLDGSPMISPPAPSDLPDALTSDPSSETSHRTGTWLDAMGLEERGDETAIALEYLGVRAALDSDDLAEVLLADPLAALGELHHRLTRGLVAAERSGELRSTRQAVHVAGVGQVLYHAADPARVPGRLAALSTWLTSVGAREHAVVVSGVLHYQLLTIHPYESANGRLARGAARLALRSRGLDPHALASAEPALASDPLGYHQEVAATLRRDDLTIWLERWGEAVEDGLRRSARRLGLLAPVVPERAASFLASRSTPALTVADYRAGAHVGPEESRGDLDALLDAGRIRRVFGSRGLRFEIV